MSKNKIFVNFRSGDVDFAPRYIHDELERRFGKDEVFLDSDDIEYSRNYDEQLLERARECLVMVSLIGPHWLKVSGADGRPKLWDENDWVRREIATALAAGRPVLPVLTQGRPQLTEEELPPDIAALAKRQAIRLTSRETHSQVNELERILREVVPNLKATPDANIVGRLDVEEVTESGYGVAVNVETKDGVLPEGSIHGEASAKTLSGRLYGVHIEST